MSCPKHYEQGADLVSTEFPVSFAGKKAQSQQSAKLNTGRNSIEGGNKARMAALFFSRFRIATFDRTFSRRGQ
jgi:hypothetical protein